ncbi:hypothetical protein ACUX4R_26920, partial [Salmonella enterica]
MGNVITDRRKILKRRIIFLAKIGRGEVQQHSFLLLHYFLISERSNEFKAGDLAMGKVVVNVPSKKE